MKCLLLFLLLPCVLIGSEFKAHLQKGGEDLSYVQTPEDSKRLGLFAGLYDMAKKREASAGEIPKILHVIWLGPASFPASSLSNVKSWIDNHPGWKVRFWTDLGQIAPDDRMEVRAFDQFPLDDLKECYYRCDNFGERSELLRYAVLLHEGGVYVDHDLFCLKAIDTLQETHDFFCGMEPLGPSILSSSVNPSPHLIASTAQHPILKAAKNWLLAEWDRLEAQYPGAQPTAVYNRVQHRGFFALSVGVKEAHARASRKDVVFPPDFFSLPDSKKALYAVHAHSGTWFKEDKGAELKTERLLYEVKEEFGLTWLLCVALAAINLTFGTLYLRKRYHQTKGRAA